MIWQTPGPKSIAALCWRKPRTSEQQRMSASSISSVWRFAQNCVKRTHFQTANTCIASLDCASY